MCRKYLWLLCIIMVPQGAPAQQDAAAAYDKLTELTALFQGKKPYSCLAIAEVRYPGKAGKAIRDTSRLVYKNGATWYRSRLVERLEGPEGELIINHELKTATLQISDSIKLALQKELAIKPNKEYEALLDAGFAQKDEQAFRDYVTGKCNVTWNRDGQGGEITIVPKQEEGSLFLNITIRYDSDSRVSYYQYAVRDAYSSDWEGKRIFRRVTTIYDSFSYDNVPDIPVSLGDYLDWDGWSVQLKKFTNYKFSLL